jgi:hypothetical protein
VRAFVESHIAGVVAVEATDGHARQSVVYYFLDDDTIKISTMGRRLKAHAVERTGWASICVMGSERPFPYATLAGSARIVRKGIGPDTARLFAVFAPDAAEPKTDEELAAMDRVILEIQVERVGPVGYIEGS